MEIEYLEHPPAASLGPWVDRYWSFRTKGPAEAITPEQCCIPLGMPEFMAHLYGRPSEGLFRGSWTAFPRAYFTGISLRPMVWHMQGTGCMVGMRLKPEGALRLLGLPLAQLCNSYADAALHLEPSLFRSVEMGLGTRDPALAIQRLEQLLLDRLACTEALEDRFVNALRGMRERGVRWDRQALYDHLFVGDRQMQRLFKERLGLSPRAYFKLMRFREAYDAARDRRNVDWMALVDLLGYSDQPHLIRDFKRFSGATPGLFVQQELPRFQRPAAH